MEKFVNINKQSGSKKRMFVLCLITVCFIGIRFVEISGVGKLSKFTGQIVSTVTNVSRYGSQGQVKTTKTLGSNLDNANVISQCPFATFPVNKFGAETWQDVDPNNSTFVFSAYHDERKGGWIRVIGVTLRATLVHFCQLWYETSASNDVNDATMNVSHATIDILLPKRTNTYGSCFINCPFPDRRVPFAVSIVTERNGCAQTSNLLEIQNIPKQQNYTKNFTVCLSPLHSQYGRAFELVEWIELNRILGADHFVVYNYSSAINIGAVLEYYGQLGIVDVIQWSLPLIFGHEPKRSTGVHYFAQASALNDCLLRSKSESKYLVNIDVDEFIIPHSNDSTWLDMLSRLQPSGVYMFRNCFFKKEWNKTFEYPGKRMAEKYGLGTLGNLVRDDKYWPSKIRSKYIARTSSIEVINIHYVRELVPGHMSLTVPINIGFLHHYNLRNKPEEKRVSDETLIDKYASVLVNRVVKTWSVLQKVQLDMPVQ